MNTRLLIAIEQNDIDQVNILSIDRKRVKAKDEDGKTPLHVASFLGRIQMMETLIKKGADVNAKANNGETPLLGASLRGMLDVFRLLIGNGADVDAKDNNGDAPLRWVAYLGNVEIARYLVENGVDVNGSNINGYTALHQAADRGKFGVANFLVEEGADVDAKNSHGSTALHMASSKGSLEIVKLLVARGADVNARYYSMGWTPLHKAAMNGHLEVIRFLLDSGARTIPDNEGRTPRDVAKGQAVKQFLEGLQTYYYLRVGKDKITNQTERIDKSVMALEENNAVNAGARYFYDKRDLNMDGHVTRLFDASLLDKLDSNPFNRENRWRLSPLAMRKVLFRAPVQPDQPVQSGSGKGKLFIVYKKRRYVVRQGPKNGSYIQTCNGKVYV